MVLRARRVFVASVRRGLRSRAPRLRGRRAPRRAPRSSPASTRSRGRRSRWGAIGSRSRTSRRPAPSRTISSSPPTRSTRCSTPRWCSSSVAASNLPWRRPPSSATARPWSCSRVAPNDPHVWLDPIRMASIVRTAQRELTKADPKGRGVYARNADAGARRAVRARHSLSRRPRALRARRDRHRARGVRSSRQALRPAPGRRSRTLTRRRTRRPPHRAAHRSREAAGRHHGLHRGAGLAPDRRRRSRARPACTPRR